MTAQPPKKPPFNVKAYLERVAAAATDRPEAAAAIYGQAARVLRVQAARPENARVSPHIQALAGELEMLSAQSTVPPMGMSGQIPTRPMAPQYTKSDLDDIVKSMEEAKRGPNGEHLDDLIAAGRLAHMENEDAQAASGAQPVSTVPKSALKALTGATALCQYGGSTLNAADNTALSPLSGTQAFQETTVVRWDGDAGEMQTVTIDGWIQTSGSGATYPASTGGAGNLILDYRPFLHCFFGSSRGAPAEVYVDVGRGTQLSVSTNFLVVNVGMDAPNPSNNPGSMFLGASMGFRSTMHPLATTRTLYFDNIAAGGTSTVQLPLFAMAIMSFFALTPANWTVTIHSIGNTVLATYTVSQLLSNAVTLPGNAWSISVQNTGGLAASCSIVFGLAL